MRFAGLLRDERGAISVVAALTMLVLGGFAAVGVDYGYIQWKRSQLQAAADAAALAGAASLVTSGLDWTKIANEAVTYGRANIDSRDNPAAAVTAADVTINQTDGWVEVKAGFTSARGNPLHLFLAPLLGRSLTDVSATARAQMFCSAAAKCVKPWSVPAKFTWNDACDPAFANNGMLDVSSPCEMASINVLGYSTADTGTQIILKEGTPQSTIVPGQYGPIDLPSLNDGDPISGAATYQANIEGCTEANKDPVNVGDNLLLEPGNMKGPTKQGVEALIQEDPGAYWDTSTKTIRGSRFTDPANSPRVGSIAFYDPRYPPVSGRNTIVVFQIAAVFLEGVSGGGDVTARFVNTTVQNPVRTTAGQNCGNVFGVSLVRDSTR